MSRKLVVTTLAAASLAIGNVCAAVPPTTASQTFNVKITVVNSCTIAVNDVDFGTVTSLISSVSANSGNDSVTCTGTSPVTVSFDAGLGSYGTRKMTDGGTNVVNYNLYNAASGGSVLGDNTGSTVTIGLTPSGGNAVNANDQFTVYGRTVAGQAVISTSYNDVITATVTF